MPEPSLPKAIQLSDFLDTNDAPYDWIIPDFLERGDRLILTGYEGEGKTTLNRQLVLQMGNGIHPFTLAPITPVRVLFLDLENPDRLTRREFRKIRDNAGVPVPANIRIITYSSGINLTDPTFMGWFQKEISHFYPEVVIIGPLYKLSFGNPVLEQEALPIAKALDFLRTEYGFALILEAHCPYAATGEKRLTRPYGWSGWSRWPEFGLHIAGNGTLSHYRLPRDERPWPSSLVKGGSWPWMVSTTDPLAIYGAANAYAQELGRRPTYRELEKKLPHSRPTIQRRLAGTDWDRKWPVSPVSDPLRQPSETTAAMSETDFDPPSDPDPLQE